MRTLMIATLSILMITTLAADDVKKEMAVFEGEWTMVSAESNGKAIDENLLKSAKRITKDGETTLMLDDKVTNKATYTIDPTKKPKEIDYTITEGPGKGKTMKGIYEVDGDSIKYCTASPDRDRPKEFASKEGSNHALSVWKKVKKQ